MKQRGFFTAYQTFAIFFYENFHFIIYFTFIFSCNFTNEELNDNFERLLIESKDDEDFVNNSIEESGSKESDLLTENSNKDDGLQTWSKNVRKSIR